MASNVRIIFSQTHCQNIFDDKSGDINLAGVVYLQPANVSLQDTISNGTQMLDNAKFGTPNQ